ncbi:hypothetical protein MN091_03100 [Xanthomonas euvesicatoria]|nr:hypothetical protein [Xanthomonas euvesicatoria]
MSPMLSSSTNLGLFKTDVLNFEWFGRWLMAAGNGVPEVIVPALNRPDRCERNRQLAVRIRSAAFAPGAMEAAFPAGYAAAAAGGILSCRASECCAGGSNSVSARLVHGKRAGGELQQGRDLRFARRSRLPTTWRRAGTAGVPDEGRSALSTPSAASLPAASRRAGRGHGRLLRIACIKRWRCQGHRTGEAARSLTPPDATYAHANIGRSGLQGASSAGRADPGQEGPNPCLDLSQHAYGAGVGLHGSQNLRPGRPTDGRPGHRPQ